MTTQIMVVEDEKIIANDIAQSLETFGYTVPAVIAYGEEAVTKALTLQPDLILMDIRLKGTMDGIAAAGHIQAQLDIPIIYLTALTDEQTLERAKLTEPFGYLLKPFDDQELRITVEIALYKHKLDRRLRDNERWLATTLKSIGEGVITTDLEGRINFMNPLAETLTGWLRPMALEQPVQNVFQIIDEITQTPLECPVTQTLREARDVIGSNNVLLLTRAEAKIPVDYNVAPISNESDALTGAVLAFRNIAGRRQLEERLAAIYQLGQELALLRREEVILQKVIETAAQTLHLDRAALGLVNETRSELQYHYCIGLNCHDDPPHLPLAGQQPGGIGPAVVLSGQAINVPDTRQESRYVAIAGGVGGCSELCVPMRLREQVMGVLDVESPEPNHFTPADQQLLQLLADQAAVALENARLYQDLQNQMQTLRATQAQLIQSERMAALGRLVASIAHEINNPLQAIQGVLTLLGEELAGLRRKKKIGQYLNVAGQEIERIATIVHRMRDFYRPVTSRQLADANIVDNFYRPNLVEGSSADLRAILNSVFQLVNKKLQHNNITVEQNLAGNLPGLLINSDHLKQILLNLILNAIDALEGHGGTIRVYATPDQAVLPGGQLYPVVRIEFADSGAGMAPDVLARVFEPLFSTKAHGSGFGLFTTYQIIQAYQGQIAATSQEGQGTTFILLLPLESPP